MGEDPDRIRREIEQTRAEMSDTVDALGHRADVKARAKESLQEKRDSAKESIVTVKEKLVGAKESMADTAPDRGQVAQGARRAKGVAQENPIGLAIGSIAVGFLAGMLIPSTRMEDERLGEMSDQVIEKAKETGQEALERGKQVAQEVTSSSPAGSARP